MNKAILKTGAQEFIKNNWNTDTLSVLLKKPLFEGISQKELVEQLEAKKKCKDKLPTWFATEGIYYPRKLSIEQTSSEKAAQYKAVLIHGKTLLDSTGGLGVDSHFFAKKFETVTHCEINEKLSGIAAYNARILGQQNTNFIATDGLRFLQDSRTEFDWVYVDPSRRNDRKGKVFRLSDCLPNVPEQLDAIFKKAKSVLLKASPLLDISLGISELQWVKQVHVVAVQNEVKEVLFLMEKGSTTPIEFHSVNLGKEETSHFSFRREAEKEATVTYGPPLGYLYEPNAAILKAGGFRSVAAAFGMHKLHEHSHLYTSDEEIDFPGRTFRILEVLPYSKKNMRALIGSQANITVRNFPLSVAELRKKHQVKEGGDRYLFFTTDFEGRRILLVCEKIH